MARPALVKGYPVRGLGGAVSRAFGLIVVTGIAKENAAMQNGALTISAVGNNKLRYEALRSVHAASLSDDGSSYFCAAAIPSGIGGSTDSRRTWPRGP